MSDETRHRIIVGVDYGTTYTGASFVSARSQDTNSIALITSWPRLGHGTETFIKTPSRIAYAAENGGKEGWGFAVESGMVTYSWTKLLLDRNTPITRFDGALEEASGMGMFRLPPERNAVQVVGDYLSKITPLEFWFTVPAMWSDQAKHATLQAARLAGFGGRPERLEDTISLVPEPEAAAIAAIRKTTTDGMGFSVKPDDGVLVCDCGGGTVDITTYSIQTVYPALTFEELCPGTGGKCGSTAIDRNFYIFMKRRFGQAFESLPSQKIGPGSLLMNKFEIVKQAFGTTPEDTVHELPLHMKLSTADPKHYNSTDRVVLISEKDLSSLFAPVVKRILALVRAQIKDAKKQRGRDVIDRIILVGGFGSSEYLRNVSIDEFERPTSKIKVTVPHNAQAAIVHGAALRALEGICPRTIRCRRHYGYSKSLLFVEGVHSEADAWVDLFTDNKYAGGFVQWMTKKGQELESGYVQSWDTFRSHRDGNNLVYKSGLYSSDATLAPWRLDHKGVRKIGDITVDFTNVDLAVFPCRMVSHKKVYKLQYSHNVIFSAQEGVLHFEARANGQIIGQTSIDFAQALYY